MLTISDALQAYADKYPKEHIKNDFFTTLAKLISENKLTIVVLTNELKKLEPKKRKELFATTLNITAATNSDAAETVNALYIGLGAKPVNSTFKALIEGLPLAEKQEKQLYAARYKRWRQNPFEQMRTKALEHELKGSLGLNSETNKIVTFATVLRESWATSDDAAIAADLTTMHEKAPKYLPQLLEQLYTTSPANLKQKLLAQLLTAAKNSSLLATELLNSSPVLVVQWLKEKPEAYFKLKEPMKVAVNKLLEKYEMQTTLDKISNVAKRVGSINISAYTKATLDRDMRQDETSILHRDIKELIGKKAPKLITDEQENNALRIIEQYLKLQPNKYKQIFFQNLMNDIKKEGLSISLLKKHLNNSDKNLLFAKWSGLANSRAAGIMSSLYETASLGDKLNPQQITHMVKGTGGFPKSTIDLNHFIDKTIKDVLAAPGTVKPTKLTQRISTIFAEMQDKVHFLASSSLHEQRDYEAIYQQFIMKAALEQANKDPKPVFDSQGHVMLFFTLYDADYKKILAQMRQIPAQNPSAQEQVEALLGSKITKQVFCNFDIKNHVELKTKFKQWLDNDKAYSHLMDGKSTDRSSIIKLQEEMSMHVLLSLRVLESKIPKEELDEELRHELLVEINKLVQPAIQEALALAHKETSGAIDYAQFNQALDKARKKLSPLCREKLVELIADKYPNVDWKNALATLKKHDFTSTTATGLDYIHSDARNQTVVRISGTKHTAHDKKIGEENQAFRLLYRNHYQANGDVKPYANPTLEARVPSIADKDSSYANAIVDVAAKLRHDQRLLGAQSVHSNGPMVYNLLTSLHTFVYDITPFERSSRQRLSADYILQGAHVHNLNQLKAGEAQALVYVQNIPVNQHTNKLDDFAFDDVTKEATLMTDMALLATLHHYAELFPCNIKQNLGETYAFAHQKYLSFLPQMEQNGSNFHKTKPGELVKDLLSQRKQEWSKMPESPALADDSVDILAVKVLFKMYSENKHRDIQFGMLAQALSVFVEPLSQAGCKSANERYQGVSGRVELLKSIGSRKNDLSNEESLLKQTLKDVAEGKTSFAKLQEYMDKAYNRHNLQGAAASFSLEDQGASSKVQSSSNKKRPGLISEMNTNVAETGFLSRLYQTCSSAMQSHKANLVELFKHIFSKQENRKQNVYAP